MLLLPLRAVGVSAAVDDFTLGKDPVTSAVAAAAAAEAEAIIPKPSPAAAAAVGLVCTFLKRLCCC
jgi:hypothetical protein